MTTRTIFYGDRRKKVLDAVGLIDHNWQPITDVLVRVQDATGIANALILEVLKDEFDLKNHKGRLYIRKDVELP